MAREEVRQRTIQVIQLIGRMTMLSEEQMGDMMNVIIEGVIGYVGRSTVISAMGSEHNTHDTRLQLCSGD